MSATSGSFFQSFTMVAGDQADALVFQFPAAISPSASPIIQAITLSADAPAFGWVLYFAPAALAAQDDIVVLDSIATIAETLVAPHGGTQVVNRNVRCDMFPVARAGLVPMGLRVTTSGKVGTGIIRIQWHWADPG